MAPRSSSRRLWIWVPLGIVVLVAGYLLAWPAPIDPLPYAPPPAPALEGALAPNEALRRAEILPTSLEPDAAGGPEDVAIDREGRIYGGLEDGRIVRMQADGSALELFADTGGRPLGLAWDRGGNLLVADAVKGLLSVDPHGRVTVLATEAGGVAFGFTDDVDVAADGRIYFSDASSRFGYGDHVLDLLEARPHGRLLRYDPQSGAVEVLLDDLYFANGVALAADDAFVLVNETARMRVTRLWLSGARAGEREIFADALVGFPDGISRGADGRFWVAVFTLRNESAAFMGPRPLLKKIVAKLPRALWPKPQPYGLVLRLDGEGRIVESLHDPGGERVHTLTSVEEHDGAIYLGTLHEPRIARLVLDPAR